MTGRGVNPRKHHPREKTQMEEGNRGGRRNERNEEGYKQ